MSKKITSPEGVAVWPALTAPTSYKDGPLTYETKLKLEAGSADTAAFIEALTEAHDVGKTSINEQRARFGEKPLTAAQLKKVAPLPWQDELDQDTGEPTGFILVKAKLKAARMVRGQEIAQRPALFDGAGTPFDVDVPVWSGSKIRISVEPRPYFVGALGYGISLQLKAAQITHVVNGTNEVLDADAYGFDTDGEAGPVAEVVVEAVEEAAPAEDFGSEDF